MKSVIGIKEANFLIENSNKMSSGDLAAKLSISKTAVQRYLKSNGLCPNKDLQFKWRAEKQRRPLTKIEDQYIIDNLANGGVKKIARELKRTGTWISARAKELGLSHILESNFKNSLRKKGSIPVNKGKKQTEFMTPEAIQKTVATRFKKGDLPPNTKLSDGVITIRHNSRDQRAYKYIRLALGKWYPLHQYNWEKVNGKQPRGMCVGFKDQDSMNCEIENLELISRAENMKRNSFHNYPEDIKQVVHLKSRLTRKINKKLKHIKNEEQNN